MRLFIFALPLATFIVSIGPRPPESPELGYALASSNFLNFSDPDVPVDNIINLDILGDNGLNIKPRLDKGSENQQSPAMASVSIDQFLEQRGLLEPDTQGDPTIIEDNSQEFLVAGLPVDSQALTQEEDTGPANAVDEQAIERVIERQPVPSDPDEAASNMMMVDFEETNKATLHIVGEGETTYSLARRFCSTPQDIQRRNSLDDSFAIEKGQVLTIPKTRC